MGAFVNGGDNIFKDSVYQQWGNGRDETYQQADYKKDKYILLPAEAGGLNRLDTSTTRSGIRR